MPRGESGRIVLEIDPSEKRLLYEALDAHGLTLKEWFQEHLRNYLREEMQPDLFAAQAASTRFTRQKKGLPHG